MQGLTVLKNKKIPIVFIHGHKRLPILQLNITSLWVDSSKHRNDAENLTLLNNIETFIK